MVFLSGSECTVSELEFVFSKVGSKASSSVEKFRSFIFPLIVKYVVVITRGVT